MKILHNISLTTGEIEQKLFDEAGISLNKGFCNFQMDEEDLRWPRTAELVKLFRAVDTVITKFTNAELNKAAFLAVLPSWHHGFPEPADSFGYLSNTFDVHSYCSNCGTGLTQIESFRIKKPPNWGNKSILQLNWVFDEYFVRPEVWETVFNQYGIGKRSLINHKTGAIIDSVVQLDIQDIYEFSIENDLPSETCLKCGAKKYLPISRGFYPKPLTKPEAHIFKSTQYVGSGARAHKMVFVSSQLYHAIQNANIKGADYKPCII